MERPLDGSAREEWKSWINYLGGEFAERVSKYTSVVIVGENPGSKKIDDARARGVPVLSWTTIDMFHFLELRGKYRLKYIPEKDFNLLLIYLMDIWEQIMSHHIREPRNELIQAAAELGRGIRRLLKESYVPIVG